MTTKRNNLVDLTTELHHATRENEAYALQRRLKSHRISSRVNNASTISYPAFTAYVAARDNERAKAILSAWRGEVTR